MVIRGRRRPYAIFNRAALAPLRRPAKDREPMPLTLTPRRRYALERLKGFRWYPNAGWMFEGAANNALVRDFEAAQWVKLVVQETGSRRLELSDIGQKKLIGGFDGDRGHAEDSEPGGVGGPAAEADTSSAGPEQGR